MAFSFRKLFGAGKKTDEKKPESVSPVVVPGQTRIAVTGYVPPSNTDTGAISVAGEDRQVAPGKLETTADGEAKPVDLSKFDYVLARKEDDLGEALTVRVIPVTGPVADYVRKGLGEGYVGQIALNRGDYMKIVSDAPAGYNSDPRLAGFTDHNDKWTIRSYNPAKLEAAKGRWSGSFGKRAVGDVTRTSKPAPVDPSTTVKSEAS